MVGAAKGTGRRVQRLPPAVLRRDGLHLIGERASELGEPLAGRLASLRACETVGQTRQHGGSPRGREGAAEGRSLYSMAVSAMAEQPRAAARRSFVRRARPRGIEQYGLISVPCPLPRDA